MVDTGSREDVGTAVEQAASNDRVVADAYDARDVADNRWIATAAYLGPTLLVTLILGRGSPYARYHMNQGLIFALTWFVLWIAGLIGNAILAFIPVIGWIVAAAVDVALVIGWIAMAVIGARHALAGRADPLPMIGKSLKIVGGR